MELAIVIGKHCYRCSEEDALDHVIGFTAAHDVSARGWQIKRNSGQWFLGKAFDGFAPMGPAIVTTDELGGSAGVHNLTVKCFLNGDEVGIPAELLYPWRSISRESCSADTLT